MTQHTAFTPPARRRSLPWLLIACLSALGLIWPLTTLLGVPSGAPRALIIVAVIGLIWIGVVGGARVPNPVAVLTLAGVGHGVITLIVAAILGESGRPIWTYGVSLAIAVAGLLALALQAALGPRRGRS